MNWRFSPDVDGEPVMWSEEAFPNKRAALQAGRASFDGPIWIGWVLIQDYAAQMPSAVQLLAEMKERAAERGADTSCFDMLDDDDRAMLQKVLEGTVRNWEDWLGRRDQAKTSRVIVTEDTELVQPDGL